MAEYCCCCFPIRLGTIILAAILLASSVLNAYVVLVRSELWGHQIDSGLRLFFGIIYIVVAVISFFGLVGSVASNRRSVRLFSTLLWFLFLCYVMISVVQVVEMFQHKQDRIDDCIGNVTASSSDTVSKITNSSTVTNAVSNDSEKNTPEYCTKVVGLALWLITVWYIIINLLMLYFCNVTARYSRKLEGEYRQRKLRDHTFGTRSASSRASTSRVSVASDYTPQLKGKS